MFFHMTQKRWRANIDWYFFWNVEIKRWRAKIIELFSQRSRSVANTPKKLSLQPQGCILIFFLIWFNISKKNLILPSGYMTPLVQLKVRNDNGTDLTVWTLLLDRRNFQQHIGDQLEICSYLTMYWNRTKSKTLLRNLLNKHQARPCLRHMCT